MGNSGEIKYERHPVGNPRLSFEFNQRTDQYLDLHVVTTDPIAYEYPRTAHAKSTKLSIRLY